MRELKFFLGEIDPIALKLGPIAVHWYGVIIGMAVLLALYLSIREGKRRGILEDNFYDFLIVALPVAIICARIYYVVFEWNYYSANPAEIIRIWDGGIAIYGGLIGAVLALIVFCRVKKLSPWLFMDVMAPTVIMAQGIGRWGNFVNQEAHGVQTTRAFLERLCLPDFIVSQMKIGGTYYQPTFLYESIWDLLGFVVLMCFRHRNHLFKRGEIVLSYVIWYSFGRFFIEGMRTDSLMLGPLRVSQWLSALLFFFSIGLICYRRYWHPNNPWYLDGNVDYD
ncbi:prolipoprotein diacylglyceryl transferase [Ligilactobacillus sp.]|uniref:prolipoprotein diacylglyceryl transferase n=1 Tax=Ligilactobacillus sp. TaxID=2767921 RepID=UPI002FE1B24B